MRKLLFWLIFFPGLSGPLSAQIKVGDNPARLHPNAVIEAESSNRGILLLPRMTTAQRDAISSPPHALMIYNTTLQCVQIQLGMPSFPNWQNLNSTQNHPSSGGTAVVSGYNCSVNSAGNLLSGVDVTGVTQTISAQVTTPGTYAISTQTTAGVLFTGSGTFTATGTQQVVLTALGRPTQTGSVGFTTNTTPACSFSRSIQHPSSGGTAVISISSCTTQQTGTLVVNNAVSSVSQVVTVNVAQTGTYSLTASAAGVTFTGTGTFSSTGVQNVTLTASGTPTAIGNTDFTLSATPSCTFTRQVSPQPSSGGTAIISSYSNCATATAGTLTAGSAVAGVTQTMTVNVTQPGTYNLSAVANGVTFSASGTFAAAGSQSVVFTATGTPVNAGTISFAIAATPSCSFTRPVNSVSSGGTAVVSSYTCTTASSGTLRAGTAVSAVTQTITAQVTQAGTYSISTVQNGVTFSGSGSFAGTGSQNLLLTATGTPVSSGSFSFALPGTPSCSFTRDIQDPSTNGTAVATSYFVNPVSCGGWCTDFVPGVPASGQTVILEVTVTRAGTYQLSATANGITFSGSGSFPSAGTHMIVLQASGTPVALGTTTFSLNTTPGATFSRSVTWDYTTNGSARVSSYNTSVASAGTLTAGNSVSGVTQTISANVVRAGSYTISAVSNGVTFSASGNFAGTGTQTIVLMASGTPVNPVTTFFTLNTNELTAIFQRTVLAHPSSNGSAVVSSYTCNTAAAGNLVAGVAPSGVTQTITANVTTAGSYNLTVTAAGVTFSGTGSFSGTGAQNIVLTASGTPTGAGTTSFTLPTSPGCSFTRAVAIPSGGSSVISSVVSCNSALNGFLVAGSQATGVTQTVTVNVTATGTYDLSTNLVNGVQFTATGSFSATGNQPVLFTAAGTPAATGATTFTVTGLGCSFSRNVVAAATIPQASGGATTDYLANGTNGTAGVMYRAHVFSFTGADQTFTILNNSIPSVLVSAWGAGGGSHTSTLGGAGGYITGTLNTSTMNALRVVVGGGGLRVTTFPQTAGTYGGGGPVVGGNAGEGGGLSGLFIPTVNTPLIIAGAGGGGGFNTHGGAGGGTTGLPGNSYDATATGGGGGTQSAGGSPGTGSGAPNPAPQAGTFLAGGRGGRYSDGAYNSGGGGSGYYGGGGGWSYWGAAGGGGSSYLHPTLISNGQTTAGSGTAPAQTSLTLYGANAGRGGQAANSYNGDHGRVVIYYPIGQ